MTRSQSLFALLTSVASLTAIAATEIPPPPKNPPEHAADERVVGHITKPIELPAPDVNDLKVPKGFKVEKFAERLGNARLLAVAPSGAVYLTRREQADVLKIEVGENGLAKGEPVRVASRPGLHGIAFHGGKVYLATPREIYTAEVLSDGTFGPLDLIITDLPDAGQHATRTLAVGPDEKLYIGVASATNEAIEPNQEAATILRASLDGKSRSIFASGLRDTIGWGWHPVTGELWGMDHGIDWLGDDEQQEELNHIQKGKRYGWPFIYGDNQENQHQVPNGGLSREEWKKNSMPMVLGYTAHAAPMQLAFYTASQFPAEYRGDAFVSMRGSWNRKPPAGYEVVRVHFNEGKAEKIEPFVTGFLTRDGERGRLVGSAIAKDGSLLFTDDRNGVIYRVSYPEGVAGGGKPAFGPIPADPMRTQNRDGVKEPLASEVLKAKDDAKFTLRSPAFAKGETIPVQFSAYDQNASIPLEWSAGPEGTKSYVLLMEDPDATSTPLPVVHWAAWNIPAGTTRLHEGFPPMERVRDPEGLRQGTNVTGKIGYQGPRPPEGEPAHRYFVQLFAVDTTLKLPLGASRPELLAALEGHVLAKAELMGKFKRPEHPKKP